MLCETFSKTFMLIFMEGPYYGTFMASIGEERGLTHSRFGCASHRNEPYQVLVYRTETQIQSLPTIAILVVPDRLRIYSQSLQHYPHCELLSGLVIAPT